jgi:hypothetical protein
MDSLENMLAELETPSNEHRSNTLDDIGNIDDFLDRIEEEARMSHNTHNTHHNAHNAHHNTESDVDYYNPHANVSQQTHHKQPSPAPAHHQQQQHQQPAKQHVAPQNPKPVSHQPTHHGGGGSHEAIQELQSQGFEKHTNKGKWISYTGGKATDFRIKGTTSTRVGLSHTITLRALDDFGNPAKVDNPREFIGCILTHVQTGEDLPVWFRDCGNCEYDLAFVAEKSGSIRMEIKLVGNPMFDIEIQVEDLGTSVWVAKPRLPAKPKELFMVDIETQDGSRPEGVAPFQVQTVGSVENLKLINNGDGTYRFQCVPQAHGHITIQITLHGQPILNSPVTVQVGDRQQIKIKQESSHVETISDTRPQHQKQQEAYDYDAYEGHEDNYNEPQHHNQHQHQHQHQNQQHSYHPRESHADVSNDDLNRLLDELGG